MVLVTSCGCGCGGGSGGLNDSVIFLKKIVSLGLVDVQRVDMGR
jgi:hypothetical protein